MPHSVTKENEAMVPIAAVSSGGRCDESKSTCCATDLQRKMRPANGVSARVRKEKVSFVSNYEVLNIIKEHIFGS